MDSLPIISLCTAVGVLTVALLYSHEGHSGAPGYLAIMAVLGQAPLTMKPTALALGMVVALIATIRSYRSGFFRWRTFWPFAVGSAPAALLAASVKLPPAFYLASVALVLLYGAVRLFLGFGTFNEKKTTDAPIWLTVIAGALIGLIAGFAGVGGGIFLSPLLLVKGWAKTNEAVAVAAPFALLNCIITFSLSDPLAPLMVGDLIYWAPAALIGAWIGAEIGMPPLLVIHLSRILSIVFVVAALRSIAGAI